MNFDKQAWVCNFSNIRFFRSWSRVLPVFGQTFNPTFSFILYWFHHLKHLKVKQKWITIFYYFSSQFLQYDSPYIHTILWKRIQSCINSFRFRKNTLIKDSGKDSICSGKFLVMYSWILECSFLLPFKKLKVEIV